MYISVIDLGTGSIRNSVYDLQGGLVEYNRTDNPVYYPEPGYAEQDPVLWWTCLKDSYSKLPEGVRDKILAISVTSQREGIVPVNSNFEPLSNMIIWLDGRTEQEAIEIEETLGREAIYRICGLVPHPVWSLSKILWIKKHQPDIYNQTFKFLQAEDYFVSRMANRAVTEFSIASRTCLLDVKGKSWSEEIIHAFNLDRNQLPELLEPGSFAGIIDPKVAEEFMLNSEVKIFTGAGDQQAAAIGSGAVFEGSVSIGIGTSSALSFTISKPVPDPSGNIILNCAAIPGMWEYEPPIWNTGGLVKWYFDQLCVGENAEYDSILNETKKIAAGSAGLLALPYFSGSGSPRWNPGQKGVFYGLSLSHTKTHLLKSLMESVAFEIRLNIDSVRRSGIEVNNVILSGGASQNLPLCQIIADMLGMPVEVSSEIEASSRGCFILVKAALEKSSNYRQIFQLMSSEKTVIHPIEGNGPIYNEIYRKYVALGDIFDQHKI
jgi:xylulokinase